MKPFNISMPKWHALTKLPALTVAGVLCGIGLERRRSAGSQVASGVGLVTLGAAIGAGAVLARALVLGKARQNATLGGSTEANRPMEHAFVTRDELPAMPRAVS
ncbi:MAG: hypothetical protein ACO1OB_13500 [Archangium sp.]